MVLVLASPETVSYASIKHYSCIHPTAKIGHSVNSLYVSKSSKERGRLSVAKVNRAVGLTASNPSRSTTQLRILAHSIPLPRLISSLTVSINLRHTLLHYPLTRSCCLRFAATCVQAAMYPSISSRPGRRGASLGDYAWGCFRDGDDPSASNERRCSSPAPSESSSGACSSGRLPAVCVAGDCYSTSSPVRSLQTHQGASGDDTASSWKVLEPIYIPGQHVPRITTHCLGIGRTRETVAGGGVLASCRC